MSPSRPDDTQMDLLAAQARSFPRLEVDEIVSLLIQARSAPGGPATAQLVEHHLVVALDLALTHGGKGLELADLYQEGTLAVTFAVSEYTERGGPATGLRHYIERVVAVHLENALAEERAARLRDVALVDDVEAFQAAELSLKNEWGREVTTTELAAHLEWDAERVTTVRSMLTQAREAWDSEIVEYLSDLDEDESLD